MDLSHRAIDTYWPACDANLEDSNQCFFKDQAIFFLGCAELLIDLLVPDEQPIQDIQCFVPGFFDRTGAPALMKWARADDFNRAILPLVFRRSGIEAGAGISIRLRHIREAVWAHQYPSAICA